MGRQVVLTDEEKIKRIRESQQRYYERNKEQIKLTNKITQSTSRNRVKSAVMKYEILLEYVNDLREKYNKLFLEIEAIKTRNL